MVIGSEDLPGILDSSIMTTHAHILYWSMSIKTLDLDRSLDLRKQTILVLRVIMPAHMTDNTVKTYVTVASLGLTKNDTCQDEEEDEGSELAIHHAPCRR